jgi:hypothetical protein
VHAQRKKRAPASQKIPDIQEWFGSLVHDDRVLALTIVDNFFADSVQRMKFKISKNGPGYFRFQQRVVKDSFTGPDTQTSQAYCQSEFVFVSLRGQLESKKDEMSRQSKIIHEKVKLADNLISL